MKHRFLSLPVRPALAGVAFASFSAQIVPTEEQKKRCRDAAKQCELFNLPEPEPPPVLHPLGVRRFPVERFYFCIGRTSKRGVFGVKSRGANIGVFKSKSVASSAEASSA